MSKVFLFLISKWIFGLFFLKLRGYKDIRFLRGTLIAMIMKKYLLISLMFMGLGAVAQTQKMPTATEMTTKTMEALEKKIKLNSTQRSIIYNYNLELSKEQLEMAKKRQAGTFDPDDVTKYYKLQNDNNDKIRNILKPEQLPEYEKFLEEQVNGGDKKKKKKKRGKDEEEEVVTGISGLKLPPTPPPAP